MFIKGFPWLVVKFDFATEEGKLLNAEWSRLFAFLCAWLQIPEIQITLPRKMGNKSAPSKSSNFN